MRISDFTKDGGFPFDQETLDFMQKAYYEIVNALLSHFTLDPADNYIISGCEVSGSIITKGWMIIEGELLYFDGGTGNANSKIRVNTDITALTFQNGTSNDIYSYSKAVINDDGIVLSSFIRIPNANDFLTSLPNATELQRGIAEIATQTEANGTTDDARFITPKKLNERTATSSRRGVIELATNVETQTGTDATRAVTSASLESKTATETRKGIAEIATQTETNAGLDDTRIVTPKKLAAAIPIFAPQPPDATETVKGIAEIATQTEANGSTDDTRFVTAKKLFNRTATTSRRGVVELATQTEVNVGTDNTRVVTPFALQNTGFAKTKIFGYVYLGNLPSPNPIASGDIQSAISLNNDEWDSRLRLYFPSVGTSQYTPNVYVESLHSNYNVDNDTILSIKNVQSNSFEVLLRELGSPAQNVRLRVQIII